MIGQTARSNCTPRGVGGGGELQNGFNLCRSIILLSKGMKFTELENSKLLSES